jgi:hypothetical protein
MEVIASTIFLSLAIFKTVPFMIEFIIYYIIIIIIISLAQLMRGVKGKHGKARAVSELGALTPLRHAFARHLSQRERQI